MEQECKASFDHLKVISKHDGASNMKLKYANITFIVHLILITSTITFVLKLVITYIYN